MFTFGSKKKNYIYFIKILLNISTLRVYFKLKILEFIEYILP